MLLYMQDTATFYNFPGRRRENFIPGQSPCQWQIYTSYSQGVCPYKGFARWLIDDSAEGGGLDLYIAGKDFSSSITLDPATTEKIYH